MVETRSAVPATSSTVMQTRLPVSQTHRAVGEPAEPDLRALQVGEDADGAADLVGGLPHQPVGALVVRVLAVAEVEPGDVHPGLDEGGDPLREPVAGPRVQTIFARRDMGQN